MKVSEVRIIPVKSGNGSTKAYASINLDGVFAVNDIRVVEGKKGLFISLPNRKGKDKDGNEKYYDIAFPTTAELRKEISDAVLLSTMRHRSRSLSHSRMLMELRSLQMRMIRSQV